jgi:hypothetical protein
MGFPKAQWQKNSSLPAFRNTSHAIPRIFMLSRQGAPAIKSTSLQQSPAAPETGNLITLTLA